MTNKNIIFTLVAILFSSIAIFNWSCKKEIILIAASIELDLGDGQIGKVETALASPVEIIIKDQNGDAFQGAIVIFSVSVGSVSHTRNITNANGKASVTWTLGTNEGEQTLTVTAFSIDGTTHLQGSPLTLTATAEYETVTIGTQVWMAKKLDIVTENSWYYNDDPAIGAVYGRLYTWEAALNACPDGWHLPSDAEWITLIDYLGGESVAGGKMKEAGTAHWISPNTDATNSSGFSALPLGDRYYVDGSYSDLGTAAPFWSSTSFDGNNAWMRGLSHESGTCDRGPNDKQYGFSVRCIKD